MNWLRSFHFSCGLSPTVLAGHAKVGSYKKLYEKVMNSSSAVSCKNTSHLGLAKDNMAL